MRWTLPAALLILAACSGGQDDDTASEAGPNPAPVQKVERSAPAEAPGADVAAPTPGDAGGEADGKSIPSAIRGRWALDAGDCAKRPGTDLTALVIDAANLRFHESHGELAQVRESDARRIVADYRFSGEGIEWSRRMQLDLADGGRTLIRRDDGEGSGSGGEGAAAGPMRYTRCT